MLESRSVRYFFSNKEPSALELTAEDLRLTGAGTSFGELLKMDLFRTAM